MRSTASALQHAISAIEDSFESIRRLEVERHHRRFAGIDRHELDRITRAITQKLLAVPLARLESIDPAAPAARLAALQQLTQRQLELIGEDPSREGLRDTPARVAKALSYLTGGYDLDVREVVGDAIFENEHRGMVLVRDIEMYSLCEHHLLPMFGRVHVAYVPDGRIIGLSKVARLVDVFARRLQVQERLTKQIADAMQEVLKPCGVAVLIDAAHMCMMMRGVQKQTSSTVTTAFRGSFLDDHGAREEVFRLVR